MNEKLEFDDIDLSELANLDMSELLAEIVQQGLHCVLSEPDVGANPSEQTQPGVQNGPETS